MAKRGDFEPGMELVKEALSLALDHSFTAEAVDAYQRLGTVLETAGDYANAREALTSALDLRQLATTTGPRPGASPAWPTSCASSASGRARSSSAAS